MTHPMLHQPFGSLFNAMFAPGASAPARGLALNAWDTEDAYVIEAELPGRTLADVSVVVHDNVVTLTVEDAAESAESAETTAEKATDVADPNAEAPRPKLLRRERTSIRGSRSLRLATPVVADDTTAVLKDGALTVRLPKAPEHRARTIAISNGDA